MAKKLYVGVTEDPDIIPPKGKKLGHTIRHATSRSGLHLTPLLFAPIPTEQDGNPPKVCPTCRTHHPVKTLHIWVDDTGTAIVSGGVLQLLRRAGMDGYTLEGSTKTPPALKVGQGKTRAEVDYSNRATVVYVPRKPKVPPLVTPPKIITSKGEA